VAKGVEVVAATLEVLPKLMQRVEVWSLDVTEQRVVTIRPHRVRPIVVVPTNHGSSGEIGRRVGGPRSWRLVSIGARSNGVLINAVWKASAKAVA
jgi:hypothetical protein